MLKLLCKRLAVVCTMFLAGLLLFNRGVTFDVNAKSTNGNGAVIYLYDPTTSQITFTYPLETQYADVKDVAVVKNAGVYEVWFTIRSADAIGRLDYTNPSVTHLEVYSLPAGSQPLNLLISNGGVWFTAPGNNYVGRLDPGSGVVTQVALPTANSYPADLDVASDGSIWFTESNTDKAGHISGSGPYTLQEVFKTAWAGGKPYGIAVNASDDIYIAMTAQDNVTYYNTGTGDSVAIKDIFGHPNHPLRLTMDKNNKAWATVLADNAIAMIDYDTLPIVNRYPLTPAMSYPVAIDVDSNNRLWYAQKFSAQIGSLNASDLYATTVPVALPNAEDTPVGIAVDDQDRVWILVQTASISDLFLPIALLNF